ncbi:MAG TPA: hypothetical protein VFR14_10865 [Candidatus Limnocylindrales bacterium]|nr:hypothetical protein [Candidatus Limnocylindrales bacterium]
MWGTKTLDRARRRLGLTEHPVPVPESTPPAAPAHRLDPVQARPATISIAFTRPEKDAFAAALAGRLGGDTPRLDSPARVASALVVVIDRAGGHGRPHVVRRPAGLYTPEYWQVSIHDADEVARAEVESIAAGRRGEA